jgi:hypothetical protein
MVLYGQNGGTECKTQDQGATGPILPPMDVTLRSGLPSWSLRCPLLWCTIASWTAHRLVSYFYSLNPLIMSDDPL